MGMSVFHPGKFGYEARNHVRLETVEEWAVLFPDSIYFFDPEPEENSLVKTALWVGTIPVTVGFDNITPQSAKAIGYLSGGDSPRVQLVIDMSEEQSEQLQGWLENKIPMALSWAFIPANPGAYIKEAE